jgi:plastocyanin
VNVWANQAGASTALSETIGSSTITLGGNCASASLSPSSVSTPLGSTVAFSATSSGCSSPQYQYWVHLLDGTWQIQRPFSADPTWSWVTSGLAPGTYQVNVWANQAGDSTALAEAIGSSFVTLTGGCTSASITPSSVTVTAGSTVTLTASSTGCSSPVYQFWLQDTNGTWQVMQSFSTSNTLVWNTAGWPKGVYNIRVWANQQGADLSTWEGNGAATITLT